MESQNEYLEQSQGHEAVENQVSIDFPAKPALPQSQKSGHGKSISSLILFVVAFYYIFDADLNFIFLLTGVLFVHELGHFVAMKYFGYQNLKIFFIPLLGAAATGDKKDASQKEMAIILLAGPIPGILIALGIALFSDLGSSPIMWQLFSLFLTLNVFNLIPFKPLDGGRLIETIFFQNQMNIQKVFTVISALGLIAIALYFETYFLLLIPFFLNMELSAIKFKNQVRKELDEGTLNYNQDYDDLSDEEYWLIRDQLLSHKAYSKWGKPFEYRITKKEDIISSLVASLALKPYRNDLSTGQKCAFAIVWAGFLLLPLIGFIILNFN